MTSGRGQRRLRRGTVTALHNRLASGVGRVPPSAGGFVMATGILSVGLALDGQRSLSEAVFSLAAVVWVTLAALAVLYVLRLRAVVTGVVETPALLTTVAATDVVGVRLSLLGWHATGAALLGFAVVLWLALAGTAVAHRRCPTVGVSFLLAVAPQSIAVLSARLAIDYRASFLALCALGWLMLGLVMYGIVLARFDAKQLLVGRGDQWISGGGLAIAALSCARCSQAAAVVGLGELTPALQALTLALWIAAVAWLPALIVSEAVSPRAWIGSERWSTVFPLGMYAVCSVATGTVEANRAVDRAGELAVWIAFLVWLLVSGATVSRVAGRGRNGRSKRPNGGAPSASASDH